MATETESKKRTRKVSKVEIYMRADDASRRVLEPVDKIQYDSLADAKAALREYVMTVEPTHTPPGATTYAFVRILEVVTPKVESVTKVTL